MGKRPLKFEEYRERGRRKILETSRASCKNSRSVTATENGQVEGAVELNQEIHESKGRLEWVNLPTQFINEENLESEEPNVHRLQGKARECTKRGKNDRFKGQNEEQHHNNSGQQTGTRNLHFSEAGENSNTKYKFDSDVDQEDVDDNIEEEHFNFTQRRENEEEEEETEESNDAGHNNNEVNDDEENEEENSNDDDEDEEAGEEQENEDEANFNFIQRENEEEDDESDDGDREEHLNGLLEDGADEPLYPGAPISVAQSMISILCFVLSFNLSGSCLVALLELISLHCIVANPYQRSLYMFKKFFKNIRSPITCHYFCKKCFQNLENKNEVCNRCQRNEGVEYFITISIISQLSVLFKRRDFCNKLRYRFERIKKNVDNLEDIYDGKIYKELSGEGKILESENNISFSWYTDGIPVFKSSSYSIWPFFLCINELKYRQRTKLDNLILGGLWFGSKKPCFNLFLSPLQREISQLYNGINFHTPTGLRTVKGIIIGGNGDLPAKASVLNLKQYNAIFGCLKCKIMSIPDRIGRGAKRVFLFFRNLVLRTDDGNDLDAQQAVDQQEPVNGVIGPTILKHLVYKPIRTTLCDDMHTVFLGTIKLLVTLWFSIQHRLEPWSLYRFLEIIDQRLITITPPNYVQRLPRSITDVAYWKANEFKVWMFYYSLPLLNDIMPRPYFEHYQLLVYGIYLLSTESVSEDDIAAAADLLTEFLSRFEVLYSRSFMTCNLHQLQHFPETVKDFGPLWVFSCFPYENANGKLKNLLSGTRYCELQICSGTSAFLCLSSLRSEHLPPESKIENYCSKLCKAKKKFKLTAISEGMAVVGKLEKMRAMHPLAENPIRQLNFRGAPNVYIFFKLFKKSENVLFTCESYKKAKKTKSSLVSYILNGELNYGLIQFFLRLSECRCRVLCENCNPTYVAVVRKCNAETVFEAMPGVPLAYIKTIDLTNEYIAVDVECLVKVNFFIKIIDREAIFVVEPTNLIEFE